MKPSEDIMRLVRELSRVRFTGADGAALVRRREEDIERLIAERAGWRPVSEPPKVTS